MPVLPLKTRVRGPAPSVDASEEEDVVDEALRLFRANMLFRNFELLGGGDRLLLYLTLFIHLCLKKAAGKAAKAEGARELQTLASGNHVAPGDPAWPLAQFIPTPKTSADLETVKGYLRQLRECVVARLVDRIYNEDGTLNKHWCVEGWWRRRWRGCYTGLPGSWRAVLVFAIAQTPQCR